MRARSGPASLNIQTYGIIFLLAIAGLALRMPERLVHGFIWAEDVVVFVKQAVDDGTPTLWRGYAGYYVLASRILGFIQSAFPLQWAPYMLAWENAAITALCVAYLFGFWWRLTDPLALDARTRAVLGFVFALAPLLVPHFGDVFLSITNLQWILSVVFVALVLDVLYLMHIATRTTRVVQSIVLAILALSGPFVLVFAPIWIPLAIRALKLKVPFASINSIILVTAAALQFLSIAPMIRTPASLNVPWAEQFGHHLLAQFFFGNRYLESLRATWPVASLTLLIGVAVGVRANTPRERVALLTFMAGAVLVWTAGVLRVNAQSPDFLPQMLHYRYGLPAGVFLLWSLTLLAATDRRRHWLWIVLLALPILFTAGRYRVNLLPIWTITEDAANGVVLIITPPPGWATSIRIHR